MNRGAGISIVLLAWTAAVASAAPSLNAASVRIVFESATVCRVSADFRVVGEDLRSLDHRIWMRAGTSFVEPVPQAEPGAPAVSMSLPIDIGTAYSMTVPLPADASGAYRVAYAVRHPAGLDGRCPTPVPAAPGAGGRSVDLTVELPPGWQPGADAFPALTWAGTTGRGVLGHVPAFVHVSMVPEGEQPTAVARIGFNRIVDLSALGLLVGASAWWLLRRRRP